MEFRQASQGCDLEVFDHGSLKRKSCFGCQRWRRLK